MGGSLIFCDFDGTIIQEEIFVELMRRFAPEASERVLPEIYALRRTLRDGLREILGTIPSRCWPAMEAFVQENAHLREGFAEFLEDLPGLGWSLLVVTGGFARMAGMVLGPVAGKIQAIHGLEEDTDGPYLRVGSPWEDGRELVAKARIFAHYAPDRAVCIGDSVTDLELARTCPRVFARDRLADYLDRENRPYLPFRDFHEIGRVLAAGEP